jgi:hypothetical protein
MATARALKLYFYNLVLFIVLFGVVASAGSDAFAAASNYAHYFASPKRVAEVLTFRSHPYPLGILQLYVCFLLAAPVFAFMVRRSVLLASCATLALWCGAQIWPEFNATGGSPEGDWQWNFNPFAWQLLFFGGMILGRYNLTPAMLRLSQRRGVVVASIALLGLATAVHAAEIWAPSAGLRFRMPAAGKEGLGAVRLAHALLVVWVLYLALARLRRPERNPVIAMAAMIGRTSLDSFAASVVVTYALALVWSEIGGGAVNYFILSGMCLAALALFAFGRATWAQAKSDGTLRELSTIAARLQKRDAEPDESRGFPGQSFRERALAGPLAETGAKPRTTSGAPCGIGPQVPEPPMQVAAFCGVQTSRPV